MRYLILGCGWVGTFVAKECLAAGHEVWASTRSLEKCHHLQGDGIFAFVLDFDEDLTAPASLPYFDSILVSVPATSKSAVSEIQLRFERVRRFLAQLNYGKIIFLSSVGIYPDVSKLIREDSFEDRELNPRLLEAEHRMQQLPGVVIYRLGGLFGLDRIFARYFQGKVCTTGEQLANFVYIEDVSRLIILGIPHSFVHGIYNVVTPMHPLKEAVIRASAAKYQLDLPLRFEAGERFKKEVCGDRIRQELNYTFKYASPLDF